MTALVVFGENVFAVAWGMFISVGVGLMVCAVSHVIGSLRRLLEHE